MNRKFIQYSFLATVFLYVLLLLFCANMLGDNVDIYIINFSQVVIYFSVLFWAFKQRLSGGAYLVFTTLVVGGSYAALFNYLYFSHTGTFFEYTGSDSTMYHSESLRALNYGFLEGVLNFVTSTKYGYDDAGMIAYQSMLYRVIEHPLITRVVNVIINSVTTFYLYKISLRFMPAKTALVTSLAYGLASYTIYFVSSGLKETIFVLTIVATFYFYLRLRYENKPRYLIPLILSGAAIFLFRVPAVLFCLVAVATAERLRKGIGIRDLVIGIPVIAVTIYVSVAYVELITWYAIRQDVDALQSMNSLFVKVLSIAAGFFGPFSTIISVPGLEDVSMFGGGLVLKSMLSIYFIGSIFVLWKTKNKFLLSLLIFCLLNMTSLMVLNRSFKTRYVIVHLPFFFVLSGYAFEAFKASGKEFRWFKRTIVPVNVAIVAFIFLWNILRL